MKIFKIIYFTTMIVVWNSFAFFVNIPALIFALFFTALGAMVLGISLFKKNQNKDAAVYLFISIAVFIDFIYAIIKALN